MHTIYTRDFPGMTTCTWCLCPCTSTTSWGEGQLTTTISIQGKNMDIESALFRNTRTLPRNWFVWNPATEKFVDYGLNMQRRHFQGAFTRIPEDAAILRNCDLK